MEDLGGNAAGDDRPGRAQAARVLEMALGEHAAVMRGIGDIQDEVFLAASILASCVANGSKILICGNGGSAADAQHLAAEFVGRFLRDRRALPALALTVDTSVLTAIGNDHSFADVFSRQVEALGCEGDTLVAISTSGSSPNVLRAVEQARSLGMTCVGIIGNEGGQLAVLCDVAVVVHARHVARIQEAHEFIIHVLCELVEDSVVSGA